MKNKEPENKKEIGLALANALDAVSKLQDLLTPEVKEWASVAWEEDDVAVEVINIGQTLNDIGRELDSEE